MVLVVALHIMKSAYRYGVDRGDILHACRNAVGWHQREDVLMLIGADRSGRLLEIGVVEAGGDHRVIHAMPARRRLGGGASR